MSVEPTMSNSKGKIFVNYRRDDDPGFTQALFQRLEQVFSTNQLFMDIEGHIKAGDDFPHVLRDQISRSDILLVVIGPRWLTVRDRTGTLRLENPDDFVRIEITWAMQLNKHVIPVLVGGAEMPRPDQLPEAIRSLSYRHALRLTIERFKVDTDGLVAKLHSALDQIRMARELQNQIETTFSELLKGNQTERRRFRRSSGGFNDPPAIKDCSSIEHLVHSDILIAVSIIVENDTPGWHLALDTMQDKGDVSLIRKSLNDLLARRELDPSQVAWCHRCLGALSYFNNADLYSHGIRISYAKAKEIDPTNATHWFALGLLQRESYSPGAEHSFLRVLQVTSPETNPEETFWAHVFLSEIVDRKGRISGSEEDRQLAENVKQHLDSALAIAERRIPDSSGSIRWIQRACVALNALGIAGRRFAQPKDSIESYQVAIKKLRELEAHNALDQTWRFFESAILNRIGHVFRRNRNWSAALDQFHSAKQIREQLIAQGGANAPALRAVARTWSYIADTYEMAGERGQAIRAREEAIGTLDSALSIRPDDPDSVMEQASEFWALAKMGVDSEENLRRISRMLTALRENDQIDGSSSELLMLANSALQAPESLKRWLSDP